MWKGELGQKQPVEINNRQFEWLKQGMTESFKVGKEI
jgi:hypothetical protein